MQAPVVQRVDSNYPADSVVCFANTYPLDSVMHPLNNRGLAGREEAGEGGKKALVINIPESNVVRRSLIQILFALFDRGEGNWKRQESFVTINDRRNVFSEPFKGNNPNYRKQWTGTLACDCG